MIVDNNYYIIQDDSPIMQAPFYRCTQQFYNNMYIPTFPTLSYYRIIPTWHINTKYKLRLTQAN